MTVTSATWDCVAQLALEPEQLRYLAGQLSITDLLELVEQKCNYDYHPILIDYPVAPRPRYGWGHAPHQHLYDLIARNRDAYRTRLNSFVDLADYLLAIPACPEESAPAEPCWSNTWYTGLDATSLYCILATGNAKRYVEVGSGNSTKFARRAIIDHHLSTSITSVDPVPRAEIDSICDMLIRQPLQDTDLSLFSELEPGDVVLVDGSHRSLPNSDVTVMFLEVLPALKPGITVGFHDIFLPYDYPPDWWNRYYSEQYILGAYLLAEGSHFTIIMPNTFACNDPELMGILKPLHDDPRTAGVGMYGNSFWGLTG